MYSGHSFSEYPFSTITYDVILYGFYKKLSSTTLVDYHLWFDNVAAYSATSYEATDIPSGIDFYDSDGLFFGTPNLAGSYTTAITTVGADPIIVYNAPITVVDVVDDNIGTELTDEFENYGCAILNKPVINNQSNIALKSLLNTVYDDYVADAMRYAQSCLNIDVTLIGYRDYNLDTKKVLMKTNDGNLWCVTVNNNRFEMERL